jgi:diacylglycerol kinase (ATP)
MPRKFIYFINPISGTKNKQALLQLIKERTEAENIPYEILDTRADADYLFLEEKINLQGITDIIICGGDGTVSQVCASLKNQPVNIGIIPMGSGNGLALAAGIPTHAGKALDIIFKGNAAFIDAFYINNQFSCMLCGLGFDAQVAHDFARQKKRGLLTYVKQTIKNFITAKPYAFVIDINGKEIKTEAFFISIANSNQFGNNVTIAPQASICDGLLDVVVVNKMSKARLLYAVSKQIILGQITNTQKRFRNKDVFYFQAKALKIKNLQNAPLHIDGDVAVTDAFFEITIAEKFFKLLQP